MAEAIAQTGELYATPAAPKEKKEIQPPKDPTDKNGIVNFRLDERLIHGQVATFWTRALQADRIIIADDEVLKDEIGVSALKAAVPAGVHLSILTVDNAAARLNAGIYSNQRVFSDRQQDKDDPAAHRKRLEGKGSKYRKYGRKGRQKTN